MAMGGCTVWSFGGRPLLVYQVNYYRSGILEKLASVGFLVAVALRQPPALVTIWTAADPTVAQAIVRTGPIQTGSVASCGVLISVHYAVQGDPCQLLGCPKTYRLATRLATGKEELSKEHSEQPDKANPTQSRTRNDTFTHEQERRSQQQNVRVHACANLIVRVRVCACARVCAEAGAQQEAAGRGRRQGAEDQEKRTRA